MAKKQSILKEKIMLTSAASAKKKMESISKKIGSKDLFPEKVELAKRTLSAVKTLPI